MGFASARNAVSSPTTAACKSPWRQCTVARVSSAMARATVFNGKIQYQGLGTDARKYSAKLVEYKNSRRLLLTYQDQAEDAYPVAEQTYTCSQEENQSYYFD